jgi:uncharacterized integral membrane protein (TIGR00698 family)
MHFLKIYAPGVLLCCVIAICSLLLGTLFPVIGSPVFSILFGMSVSFMYPALLNRKLYISHRLDEVISFKNGTVYTSKKILQYAIILLGFGLNLITVFSVGLQSLTIIITTLTAAFVTAYIIGKALHLESKMVTLISIGTAICGGSAIAAASPVIDAKDEDIAHAISTIFLFNIIAVFIFPFIGHLLHLSDTGFGMWAGTAINDTSSVVAAGAIWSNTVGNNLALHYATVVKLTRTLFIIPVTLILALYISYIQKKKSNDSKSFHPLKVFPWFVIGFLATSMLATFLPVPEMLLQLFAFLGKFFIVMAMAAIGLHTQLHKLIQNGKKPILLGLCCWIVVAWSSLLMQHFLHLW